MPIAEVESRECPLHALCRQAGFDVFVVVDIFCGIIVIELKRADLEINKKRTEYQKQTNQHFGADIKIILIVSKTHRPSSTQEKIFFIDPRQFYHFCFLMQIKCLSGYFVHLQIQD